MVTYVQNKLIKLTKIVDISILGLNAHCTRKKKRKAKRCSLKTRCAFATSLQRFSQIVIFYFLCVYCESFMCDWDKRRSKETQRIQSV